MSEKKATGYKPQSAATISRNKAAKGGKHAKRMSAQNEKQWQRECLVMPKRGVARRQRRAGLAAIYAKRLAAGNVPA